MKNTFGCSPRAQNLPAIKVDRLDDLGKNKSFLTFLLWLITFEPIVLKQSFKTLLKMLMCGKDAFEAQWLGSIFTLLYTSLNMTVLPYKKLLVQSFGLRLYHTVRS